MSTVQRRQGVRPRRWTKEEYYRLGELGFFDGQRVEFQCRLRCQPALFIRMNDLAGPPATADFDEIIERGHRRLLSLALMFTSQDNVPGGVDEIPHR